MLLTGCAKPQSPQVEYQVTKAPQLSLPAELTSPISVPEIPDQMTYADSVALNVDLYGAIAQCNIDRFAIQRIEAGRQ
ncbi:Rz1-like lysis system protein LysC [Chimaeribacter arupi]|uniref:Rz1-like lysis system protein LysC n=1 Tax=Chimaeribacter arupi TaxID=2060066 RepID=UPI003CE501B2